MTRFDAPVARPSEQAADDAVPADPLPPAAIEGRTRFPFAARIRRARRVRAVLVGLGSIAAGFAVAFVLVLLGALFSFLGGSEPSSGPVVAGLAVAGLGMLYAVVLWVTTPPDPDVRIEQDALVITYPGFGRPLTVPRALIRFVAIDDRPMIPFQSNARFAVEGVVPDGAFVDALDRIGLGIPPVVHADGTAPAKGAVPADGAGPAPRADDGSGWATVGAASLPRQLGREEQWLYRPDGSAFPILRTEPVDIPNVAIMFEMPLATPRPAWTEFLAGPQPLFYGGATVSGLMMRLSGTPLLPEALAGWNLLRPPSADDVIAGNLRLPKPLRGWRIAMFAVITLVPLVIEVLSRT